MPLSLRRHPRAAAQVRFRLGVHPVAVLETVRPTRRCRIRRWWPLLALMATTALLLPPPAAGAAAPAAAGPARLVDVFAGTAPSASTFGGGHDFPGASAPFGMVQWSPDTTPADQRGSGGYDYRDHHLRGFSLTHLSGAGCETYGDFPFLPTTEPLTASPAAGAGLAGRFQPGFSHRTEEGRPGYYSVWLNPARGAAIRTELSATTRTGIARFTFPGSPHASVLVNAGGSAQPDDLASVTIHPARAEIDGVASSGLFCGQRPRYRVYVAIVFDRAFQASGTWTRSSLEPGSQAATDESAPASNPSRTAQAGAYATFDTSRNRVVTARVGLSFVSVADARANLAAEDPGLGFARIVRRAEAGWNRSLQRVSVSGGSRRLRRTFYTALYHALLAPRTFSDVGGAYLGMDGAVHRARGRIQYADFSGWDVYRTEIPLLALLVPRRAGQIVSSLLADAAQSGCLPRWSLAAGQTMTMVGDSADPAIASAFAFGARGFDRGAALAAMVRGASEPCRSANAEYVERQGLGQYLALGYVPFDLDTRTRNANSLFGDPEAVWASAAASLEYAVDDFAIAQYAARALGDGSTYAEMIRRSGTWRRLFDPATDTIEPRYADGGFPAGYSPTGGAGFVEGDAAQYTWAVPQDPAGLFGLLGGRAAAARRLDRFLRALNGGAGATHTDHALLGNEPNLNVPWLYDWAGQPYRTQLTTRRALLGLYSPSPAGLPGNDDLGTLSSWYVFGALGLYPEVPGVGLFAISSPLFPRAVVRLAGRRRLTIAAAGRGPYVQSLRWRAQTWNAAWTTYCTLARGGTLAYALGRRPNRAWGAAAGELPPSFGPQRPPPSRPCAP